MTDLIHHGHPLMQAITDLQLEAHRSKLKQGAVLVDPNDDSLELKVLFMMIKMFAKPVLTHHPNQR